MKRRVLVTGATGFLGRRILEALGRLEDVEPIAACRDPRKLPPDFRGEVRTGDLLEPEVAARLVRSVDVVCNAFAWTSLWGREEEDRRRFRDPILRLLDASRAAGVRRFVLASTTSAAAPGAAKDPRSPGDPPAYWPHLRHLIELENALRDRASSDFECVTLRLGLFAGEGLAIGLLPMLLPRLRTRLVPLVAGGRTRLPILDGRDAGEAFARAAVARGLGAYEAFDVVGPGSPEAREVFDFLHAELGLPKPFFSVPFGVAYRFGAVMEALDPWLPWPPLVTRSIVRLLEETGADNQRAESMFGYRPRHEWRPTLREEVTAMRAPANGRRVGRRLRPGDVAPPFVAADHRGRRIELAPTPGRLVLLSFYRYASCPLCNLRVHALSTRTGPWKERGLETIAVFQSPAEKLAQYVGRQDPPFPLVADPEQRLYAAYGVEHSFGGLLAAWAFRTAEIGGAIFRHGFRPGSIEGGIHRIPADFLIGPDGRVRVAYYGRDIGDHLPIEAIDAELAGEREGLYSEGPIAEREASWPPERTRPAID